MSFREIIDKWPDHKALADAAGVSYMAVAQWKRRDAIPGKYWQAIANDAKARRIAGATIRDMASIAGNGAA